LKLILGEASALKIGIFTDSYLPYTSGVVRSIQTFSEELMNCGHEVYVFAPNYRHCQKENRVFRFASIPSPTNPDFALAIPFSLRLRPFIRRLNLDLIHVHSPFLLGRLGAQYARRLGVPLVFTFHTIYEKYVHYVPFNQKLARELTQRIGRDFCNRCDLILVPTAVVGSYLQEIGVRTPIQILPTGIKIEDFQKGDPNWLRHRYGIAPEEKILLFVGRLGQEKNIEFLLECFQSLRYDYPLTRLVLVGSGPAEGALKKKVTDLGIADGVVFTGLLPYNEVIHCYTGADVFVFASVTETQGLVIGEAKSAGLPAVVVDAYGVSEMIEEGKDGFLTGLEKKEFTNRVCQLLKDERLRKEMSSRAVISARRLSSASCAQRLIVCYQEVLKDKKYNAINERVL